MLCKHVVQRLMLNVYRHIDILVVVCWHRVLEVPGSIPRQGPRHTKDIIKMEPVVDLFSTKYRLFLKN